MDWDHRWLRLSELEPLEVEPLGVGTIGTWAIGGRDHRNLSHWGSSHRKSNYRKSNYCKSNYRKSNHCRSSSSVKEKRDRYREMKNNSSVGKKPPNPVGTKEKNQCRKSQVCLGFLFLVVNQSLLWPVVRRVRWRPHKSLTTQVINYIGHWLHKSSTTQAINYTGHWLHRSLRRWLRGKFTLEREEKQRKNLRFTYYTSRCPP